MTQQKPESKQREGAGAMENRTGPGFWQTLHHQPDSCVRAHAHTGALTLANSSLGYSQATSLPLLFTPFCSSISSPFNLLEEKRTCCSGRSPGFSEDGWRKRPASLLTQEGPGHVRGSTKPPATHAPGALPGAGCSLCVGCHHGAVSCGVSQGVLYQVLSHCVSEQTCRSSKGKVVYAKPVTRMHSFSGWDLPSKRRT